MRGGPDALLALGRDQVVRKFEEDPRFGDTILDFNLMMLGFRQDRIRKENGNYEGHLVMNFRTPYRRPSRLSAAGITSASLTSRSPFIWVPFGDPNRSSRATTQWMRQRSDRRFTKSSRTTSSGSPRKRSPPRPPLA